MKMSTKKNFSFTFARGGSKGLKNKNLMVLGDHPLIGHSINSARQIKDINKIFVSTDSIKIAEISREYGAEIIMRPRELATDKSPEWLSWQHAVHFAMKKYGLFDKFLSLPTTSPLRSSIDIQNCLDTLTEKVDTVLTMTESQRNPWFNMAKYDPDGNITLINKNINIKRRQDAPICFDICTAAYVSTPNFILNNTSIWDGIVKGVKVPFERAIDIDNQYDFDIANYFIKNIDKS